MKQALKAMQGIDSMYCGNRKFSEEQLIFVCEVMVASVFDRMEAQMPYLNEKRYRKTIIGYFDGLVDGASMSLAILYAQLTGDGISPGDVLDVTGLGKAFDKYTDFCDKYGPAEYVKRNGKLSPDSRPIAEKVVKKLFGEYLGKKKGTRRNG